MSDNEYEWDPEKCESNFRKHGIDFLDAIEIFEHPHLTVSSNRAGEARQISLGRIGPLLAAVVWTDRDGVKRLISARVARRNERRAYHARFGP